MFWIGRRSVCLGLWQDAMDGIAQDRKSSSVSGHVTWALEFTMLCLFLGAPFSLDSQAGS